MIEKELLFLMEFDDKYMSNQIAAVGQLNWPCSVYTESMFLISNLSLTCPCTMGLVNIGFELPRGRTCCRIDGC